MSSPLDEQSLVRLDSLIRDTFAIGHFPGLAVAVIRNSAIMFEKTLGFRDLEQQLPFTSDTLFPLASCSKSFCALAIMTLIQDRKLGLNDPISQYLDWWPTNTAPTCTIHHILSHSSGYPDLYASIEILRNRILNPDHVHPLEDRSAFQKYMEQISAYPVFAPGERFIYNNDLYLLLGLLIEKITGESYATYVQNRIFSPLRMTHSIINGNQFITSSNRVQIYANPNGQENPIKANVPYFSLNGPAGGIFSTLPDLIRYLQFQLHPSDISLLSTDLINRMRQNYHQLNTPETVGYGYGWFIDKIGDHPLICHGGNLIHSSAWIGFLPSLKIGIILTHNSSYTAVTSELPRKIVAILLYQDFSQVLPDVQYQHLLSEISGTYTHLSGAISLQVKQKSGRFEIRFKNPSPFPEDRKFFYVQSISPTMIKALIPGYLPNQAQELIFLKSPTAQQWGVFHGNLYYSLTVHDTQS